MDSSKGSITGRSLTVSLFLRFIVDMGPGYSAHKEPKVLQSFFSNSILKRYNGNQKIIDNVIWLLFDKVLRMGVGLLIGVWVARYLGPEQFGIFNYAIAIVTLLSALAFLGLDSIVVREIIRSGSDRDTWQLLGSAFALRCAASLLTLLVLWLTIIVLRPDDPLFLSVTLLIGFGYIFQSFDIIDFYFQSRVQAKYTVYAKNAAFLVLAAVRAGLIYYQFPLIAFAWAYLAEIVLGAVLLVGVYTRQQQSIQSWRFRMPVATSLLKDSWPLILSGIVVMIYMRIDQIMLGEMVGDRAVGNYSSAVKISEIWYFIPMAITSSVFPSIMKAKSLDAELYTTRLQQLYTFLTWLSLLIAILVTFTADHIMGILYGNQYSEAGPVLAVHIWSAIFVFQGVASSQFLMAENLTKISFYRTAIGAAVNVGLNLVLIPLFREMGAALATLIAYFAATFSLFFFKETRYQCVLLLKSFIPALPQQTSRTQPYE